MKTELFEDEPLNHRRTWIWAVPVLAFLFFILGQILVLLPTKVLGLISRETIETYPTILYLVIGAFGMTALLVMPALLNAAVVMGLLPTKGLTLPFLSYGRSSLFASALAVGVLLRVAREEGTRAAAGGSPS